MPLLSPLSHHFQRAEAEAAALYDEFVASFEADEGGAKTFVHGETIQPGSSASASASKAALPPHTWFALP